MAPKHAKFLRQVALTLIGIALIIFGLLTVLLPVPVGLISVIAGLAILSVTFPPARHFLRWLRRKAKPLDAAAEKAEEVLPEPLAKPLRETAPNGEDEEEEDENAPSVCGIKRSAAAPDAHSHMVRRPINRPPQQGVVRRPFPRSATPPKR